MKRLKPRGPGNGRGPIQYFTYGPWRFNISKAAALAANGRKYQPEMRRPAPDWVGPNIDIDYAAVEPSDLGQPVIFATVVHQGQPWRLLIDGNHRVLKALRHQAELPVVTLDLEDTLAVLTAPGPMMQQMRQDGRRLGLLRGPR